MSSPTTAPAGRRLYRVAGMTCHHCVMSVTEEVSEVPGVTGVAVELDSGALRVDGDGFGDRAIQNAVAAAGYEVVS